MVPRKSLVSLTFALVALAAAPALAEDLERGRQVFGLCLQCHGEQGQGNPLALGPAIAGLEEWYVAAQLRNFRNGVRGMHPDDLGGLRMYPMSLSLRSDEDLQAVAAYVASLPEVKPVSLVTGGDPAKGATLYAVCGACHGPDGAGNQAMNAPRLAGTSDWYMLTSLEKYKAGIRGGNPGNPNSVLMRGMAAQLVDEQAMKDVIAHIMTLGN
jgi:cytochrome c oxidase subunit 2